MICILMSQSGWSFVEYKEISFLEKKSKSMTIVISASYLRLWSYCDGLEETYF